MLYDGTNFGTCLLGSPAHRILQHLTELLEPLEPVQRLYIYLTLVCSDTVPSKINRDPVRPLGPVLCG